MRAIPQPQSKSNSPRPFASGTPHHHRHVLHRRHHHNTNININTNKQQTTSTPTNNQERLLAEVDAYGRGRAVAHADLHRFPYAEAVVRESLRLFPPAILTNRLASKEAFEIAPGVRVDKVRCCVVAAVAFVVLPLCCCCSVCVV